MDKVTYQYLTGQFLPQQPTLNTHARATANIIPSTVSKVRNPSMAREKGKKMYHRHPNKYGVKVKPLPKRNTRPLNSFFAFRAYYAKIFKGLQQKETSSYLSKLWDQDPFKAKWAILAKAYSVIRDEKGMRDADLQKFLKINVGFVETVTPEAYLETLGWEFVVHAEAGTTIRRKFDFDVGSIDRNLLTTNKSVDDVVQNCYYHGYVTSSVSSLTSQVDWEAITMASSAQPSTSGNQSLAATTNATYGEGTATLGRSSGNTLLPQQLFGGYGIVDGLTDMNANQDINVFPSYMDQQMAGPFDQTNYTHGPVYHPSVDEIDEHMGLYPHNIAFNPWAAEVLAWDPFAGDPFDAFDISSIDQPLNEQEWFKALVEN